MIINCPKCSHPVLKGLAEIEVLEVSFAFAVKCPGCGRVCKVTVDFEGEAGKRLAVAYFEGVERAYRNLGIVRRPPFVVH